MQTFLFVLGALRFTEFDASVSEMELQRLAQTGLGLEFRVAAPKGPRYCYGGYFPTS